MNEPLIAIKKLESIILLWCEQDKMSPAYFAASKAIIKDLELIASERGLTSYTSEKLTSLIWHIDAMFGSDIDNGHAFSDHKSWALGEISTLGGQLCFGAANGHGG